MGHLLSGVVQMYSSLAVSIAVGFLTLILINYATKHWPKSKPDSVTLLNTLANSRSSNTLARRRAERSASFFDPDHDHDPADLPIPTFRLISSPIPSHIKPAIKRTPITPALPLDTDSPKPSPAVTVAVTPSTVAPGTSAKKRVRVIEPDVEALEALREYWSGVGTPMTGIGGYRRTRLFYSKSQGGGRAQARKSPVRRGVPLTPGESDKEDTTEEDDGDSSDNTSPMTAIDTPTPVGRPGLTKLAVPTPPGRSSSLSPSKSPTRTSKSPEKSTPQSPASPTSPSSKLPPPSALSLRTQPAYIASRPGNRRRASSTSSVTSDRSASPPPQVTAAAQAKSGQAKRNKKKAVGAGGNGHVAKVTYIEEARTGETAGPSSSEFEDTTTDDDTTKHAEEVVLVDQLASRPPRVTIAIPAVVKPTTPPPASPNRVTRSVTASPPTAPNAVSASPTSPSFPKRTSSMPAAERPARMLGGRADSFGEPSPRTLVA